MGHRGSLLVFVSSVWCVAGSLARGWESLRKRVGLAGGNSWHPQICRSRGIAAWTRLQVPVSGFRHSARIGPAIGQDDRNESTGGLRPGSTLPNQKRTMSGFQMSHNENTGKAGKPKHVGTVSGRFRMCNHAVFQSAETAGDPENCCGAYPSLTAGNGSPAPVPGESAEWPSGSSQELQLWLARIRTISRR